MLTTTSNLVISGIRVEKSRAQDKRFFLKKIYQLISDPNRATDSYSVAVRTDLVRYLEKTLRTEFKNTRDCREKMEKYLGGYDLRLRPPNERVKRARKKMGWTQKELAEYLGYSTHVAVHQFELGKRFPSARILQWVEGVECNIKKRGQC